MLSEIRTVRHGACAITAAIVSCQNLVGAHAYDAGLAVGKMYRDIDKCNDGKIYTNDGKFELNYLTHQQLTLMEEQQKREKDLEKEARTKARETRSIAFKTVKEYCAWAKENGVEVQRGFGAMKLSDLQRATRLMEKYQKMKMKFEALCEKYQEKGLPEEKRMNAWKQIEALEQQCSSKSLKKRIGKWMTLETIMKNNLSAAEKNKLTFNEFKGKWNDVAQFCRHTKNPDELWAAIDKKKTNKLLESWENECNEARYSYEAFKFPTFVDTWRNESYPQEKDMTRCELRSFVQDMESLAREEKIIYHGSLVTREQKEAKEKEALEQYNAQIKMHRAEGKLKREAKQQEERRKILEAQVDFSKAQEEIRKATDKLESDHTQRLCDIAAKVTNGSSLKGDILRFMADFKAKRSVRIVQATEKVEDLEGKEDRLLCLQEGKLVAFSDLLRKKAEELGSQPADIRSCLLTLYTGQNSLFIQG